MEKNLKTSIPIWWGSKVELQTGWIFACEQKFGGLDKKEMDVGDSWKTTVMDYDNGGNDRLVFLSSPSSSSFICFLKAYV